MMLSHRFGAPHCRVKGQCLRRWPVPSATQASPAARSSACRAVDHSLSDWIKQEGGVVDGVHLCYTTGSEGGVSRQLTTTRDVKPGDRLITVPAHCQVCYTSTSSPQLLRLYEQVPVGSDSGKASWQFKMALQVLEYWSQGGSSSHARYMLSLPGIAPGVARPNLAMFFSDEELQATQKQALATDAVSQRYWWHDFAEQVLSQLPGTAADPFNGQLIDREHLGWALSVATSRSFAIRKIGGHTMVPLIDMADHSVESNTEVRANDDSSISMVANKPLAAGQAVQLKYGSHDNHNLLLSYGFLLPDNPYEKFNLDFDVGFVLQAIAQFAGGGAGKASFAFGALKPWQLQLLEQLQLVGAGARKAVYLSSGQQPVDPRLLGAVRVMLLQDKALAKGKPVEQLCQWDLVLSKSHEVLVLKALVGLCTVLYKGFPTSIQQDQQALAQLSPGSGMQLAVAYRLGSKRLLEAAAKQVLVRLAALGK